MDMLPWTKGGIQQSESSNRPDQETVDWMMELGKKGKMEKLRELGCGNRPERGVDPVSGGNNMITISDLAFDSCSSPAD